MEALPQHLDEIFRFFESRTNFEKNISVHKFGREYRLDRMRSLCAAFDNPQESYEIVHIAGSKGKGSTGAYLSALLHANGRRVGLYSSPHLLNYRERFRIMGASFPESTAFRVGLSLIQRLESIENSNILETPCTTFELLTLFGFLLFRDMDCQIIVLETGLGGRLDATNIVSCPLAVVITPIEHEHTEILGKRLQSIAREKAGIIKHGTQVWSAHQKMCVLRVLKRKARKSYAALYSLKQILNRIRMIPGQAFTWDLEWHNGQNDRLSLRMGGRAQAENAALALAVFRMIFPDTPMDFGQVLGKVVLPGRFQLVCENPIVVLDGAHTPGSVAAVMEGFFNLINTLKKPHWREPILLFGSVLGKNHQKMAQVLSGSKGLFHRVVVSTPGYFKASDPPAVAQSFRRCGADADLLPKPVDAWNRVMEESAGLRPILVTGSFYMAGEIAAILRENSLQNGLSVE